MPEYKPVNVGLKPPVPDYAEENRALWKEWQKTVPCNVYCKTCGHLISESIQPRLIDMSEKAIFMCSTCDEFVHVRLEEVDFKWYKGSDGNVYIAEGERDGS